MYSNKNLIMQIIINLLQILIQPKRPYNVSLYEIWSYVEQWTQSYGRKKFGEFFITLYGKIGRVFPSGGTGGSLYHDFVPLHRGLVPHKKFPENNRETIAYCSQTIAYFLKSPHESTSWGKPWQAGGHSFVHHHGSHNIIVWWFSKLWTAITLTFTGLLAWNLQRLFKTGLPTLCEKCKKIC